MGWVRNNFCSIATTYLGYCDLQKNLKQSCCNLVERQGNNLIGHKNSTSLLQQLSRMPSIIWRYSWSTDKQILDKKLRIFIFAIFLIFDCWDFLLAKHKISFREHV